MTVLARSDYTRGWVPDADALKAPENALLRADNLILDELGLPSLRYGSAKINQAAFADPDVHSLATFVLNGSRLRMAGATDAVYANGTSILSSVSGSGDVAFGSYAGQVLFARGATTKKYDGTTVRNWGIAMSGTAPTVAAASVGSKDLATCAAGETTWSVEQGTSVGIPGNAVGHTGAAATAIIITPAAGFAGEITKTFAADQDFTALSGGATATDDSGVSLWVKMADSNVITSIRLVVDVNGGTFLSDYYEASLPFQQVQGFQRITLHRRDLVRHGSTTGKDWSTVRAVKFYFYIATGSATVTVDAISLYSGNLSAADLTWQYVYVHNDGVSVAKSAPSSASSVLALAAENAAVTVPADASRDSQVNEIWIYRQGGALASPLRTAVQTGVSGTGAVTINDTLSDVQALTVDLPLDATIGPPPADIIDIAGPYFDRVFALTATTLYPSRRLSADAFSAVQAVTVGGPDERAYWVRKAFGGLLIGTSKDVYRLEGDGAELPDGEVNFTLVPLNIDYPPIGPATAQEGPLLVYLASDGWRALGLGASQSLVDGTRLLYRGQTRHGVGPVNLATGRFKAAVTKGQLIVLTPEGSDTTASTVLYRYVLGQGRVYRHVYPQAFRCVTSEPDGTVIASDASGFVRVLDTGTTDDDAGIPVTLWTRLEDGGLPMHQKDLTNLHVQADTGQDDLAVGLHLDGADHPAASLTVAQDGMGDSLVDLTNLDLCRQVQLRVTGTLTTFRWGSWVLLAQILPMPVLCWDSGPMDTGVREQVWFRLLRLKVRAAADLVITPIFDGVATASVTVPVTPHVTTMYIVPLGRGQVGRIPQIRLTSPAPFYPYWLEIVRRTTGPATDEGTLRIPIGVGGEVAA